ncbi:MAG: SpoIIE family protein phosphatase [Thermodesulfobacteriota bacterium]
MSVRARLFLLLLALSVLPMLLLRINARHHISELTGDLVKRSQHLLVGKAKAYMLLMVEDHAELWRREILLLEQTLRLQAAQVEDAAPQGAPDPSEVAKAYKAAMAATGMNVLGQITVFEDGKVVASNENVQLPRRFDGREARWYRRAVEAKGLVWTAPVIDPNTRAIALTASFPVFDRSGRLAGVTAIMAPLSIGGMSRVHTAAISPRLRTYLVDYDHPDAPQKGLRVIGEADPKPPAGDDGGLSGHQPDAGHGKGRRMGMMGLTEPAWLTPDDPAERERILSDLNNALGEVRQAELGTKDYIWAYAPSGIKGLALVILAPKSDVSADARKASDYIQQSIDGQFRFTFFVLMAAMAVITLAAWMVSLSFTRPLSRLARAHARLGDGDFSVRVTPSGGREIEELGRAFNEMVPGLEERTRLREAMELAREVHRRLIPAELPRIEGLELAGASIACEETGGDSFDVIPAAHGDENRAAALVGDVSGHGLDAALLMATARAYLRMRALQPGTPAQVVTDVNAFLSRDTAGTGRFMTLFYLELDPFGRRLTYVRAGHDPAMLYRSRTGDFEELSGPGIPLGVLEDRVFVETARPWPEPGDVLLVGSDGLWESRGPDGEMFGKDRVREALRSSAAGSAGEILAALLAALDSFREGEPAEDDVTLLVLKAKDKETA